MKDDTPVGCKSDLEAETAERAELAGQIDTLMEMPPKRQPSIIVMGDEAVFAITPAPRG